MILEIKNDVSLKMILINYSYYDYFHISLFIIFKIVLVEKNSSIVDLNDINLNFHRKIVYYTNLFLERAQP